MNPKDECQELIDSYLVWLKEGLSGVKVSDAFEITTPFLDRHNDHLQVYSSKVNGSIRLSDDGYIMAELGSSGLEFSTPKRKAVLDTALRGFGVRLEGRSLVVDASSGTVGQKMHSLVQAMIAVNDMFVLAQPRVSSFFFEDVKTFLDLNQIRYIDRVKVSGRSGFDHAIDFLIPSSSSRPERFLQTINAPTKSSIATYLFSLGDTRAARERPTEAYTFLNDEDNELGAGVVEALEAYEVRPLQWTRRDEAVEELAS